MQKGSCSLRLTPTPISQGNIPILSVSWLISIARMDSDSDFCTIQILWKRYPNMFCIIPCSHRVWNLSPSPNLNPSPAVEISRQYPYRYLKSLFLNFGVTCCSFCAATFTLVYNYIISNMHNHEICPIPFIVKCLLFKLKTKFLSK